MSSDDTEITLGVGKLLGLFLLLAALCGVFFSIGHSLGKSSGREQVLGEQPGEALAASPPAATAADPVADKQPDVAPVKPDSSKPASDPPASASNPQSNLTFYKAVQQNSTDTQAPAKAPETSASKAPTDSTAVSAPAAKAPVPTDTASTKNQEIGHAAPVTGPGTIVVQIAAVSREDDAVALAGALRKKNYNVFVVNNPVTNDKLYHVQVGPFATIQEAEAMKAKLTGEGYNPIIKR
jgi:DedD protein